MAVPGLAYREVCAAELHEIVNMTATFAPKVAHCQVSENYPPFQFITTASKFSSVPQH